MDIPSVQTGQQIYIASSKKGEYKKYWTVQKGQKKALDYSKRSEKGIGLFKKVGKGQKGEKKVAGLACTVPVNAPADPQGRVGSYACTPPPPSPPAPHTPESYTMRATHAPHTHIHTHHLSGA